MNKVYKVVWNASLGIWVAVSELAKGKTKSSCLNEEQHNNDNSITNKLQDKLFFLKPLSFAIITILIPSFVFAETGVNGGTSSQNNSTAISPSNAQCGTLSTATISGTSTNSTAIGCGTTIDSAPDSVAIGKQNTISATNTTNQQIADRRTGASLVNYPTGQTGYSSASVAIGTQNTTGAGGGVAIGNGNQVDSAFHGVAIGQGNRTTGGYAVSLGIGNAASGVSAVSVGTANDASGNTAVAIGRQTYSKADYGIAVGNVATVEVGATNGIAIGNTASVLGTATNSVAIGKDATSNVSNSVALGAGSTTTAQSGNSFLTNVAPSATNGVVSVGTTGTTRRIQNVADGAALTDAVNVAQLDKAYDDAHSRLATALGGGATYDPVTNAYTAPTYNVTTDPNAGTKTGNVNNVGAALSGLDTAVNKAITFNANTGSSTNKLGSTLNITGTGSTAGTYSGNNLKTSVSGNTVSIQMADAPVFTGTVTAGNLATGGTLSVTGVSNLNGGANLNNQKITNVAAGTASGDAVNFGQLTTTNNNVTTAQNAANAAQTSANAAQTTANSALTEAQKGLNFRANAGATDKVSLGETVTLADGTNTTVTYDAATNTYKYSVVDAPTFTGTVTAGNLATGGTLSVTGVSNLNGGANLNNQKITNVAAGTASGDAVNFGQLTTTNNNVTTAQTTANSALAEAQKGINFGDGSTSNNYALGETINVKGDSNINSVTTAGGVQLSLASDISVDSVTTGNSKLDNSGLVITGGPSITTAGIDAANTNISNVADATTADQAVNKGQLDAVIAAADGKTDALGNSTANNLGGGATYNSTTGAVTAPTYSVNGTDVNNVGAAISELDKGWNLASNGVNAGAIKAGDTVDIGTAAGETNLQVAKSGNTIQYSLSRDLDLDSVTTGNSKLDNSGLVITGGPSITTAGIDAANTNISNVADATTADQAVNKGQLDAVTAAADGKTDALGNSTANNLGGGATYNSTTGAVTAPTYSVNGTDVNNVGAAISELDKGWNLASNGANAGAIKAGDTVDIGTAAGETNLQVAKSGNTIQYSLSRDLDLDSVTTGNSKLDNSGLVITGGPSITTAGIDAANTNISNVADATTADQAVNKGQLDAVTAAADGKTDALGNSTANNLGGGATYNSTTGAVTAPTYSVNGTDVNNVGAAISELDKGWNLASNGANAGAIKAGDTVDIGTAAGETNLQVAKSGNTIQYSLSRDLDLDSVTTGNSKLDNSGLVITGGPSITTAGIDAANTNISNVADATTADQAVNKGQLDAVTAAADGKTDALGNSTANNLGGGATYNSTTGAVTAPTYSVNGTDVNNVGAAISELDKGWNLASNGANAGAIKAGDTVDIGTAAGETNLQVAKSGNTIQYSLSRDLDLDSVTTGNSKLDNSGLVITGGPSITTAGIDAANTNISNVADATTADQAVNKGQLDAVTAAADGKTDALGNSTANNLGGGATYNSTTGAVTAPTYSVNGTDVNNVGAAISELDKGWNLASNGANAGAIKAGDTVDIGTAAGETNLQVAKSGNTIQYSLSRDLDLDSVTTGNSKLDNSGLVITGGPSITTAGIDAANTNISNVADATTADQAVNKGQLDAVTAAADGKTDALGNSTANNLGGGATYNSTTGAVTAPTYSVNGTDVNNVGAAISELDKGWNLASNGANAGAIKAGDTVDIGTAAGETNLQVAKSGNTIQYSLSRDLDLDSVTTGNSKLDNSGLVITGGPSITTAGIDAANTNISNVADATTADQAVNKGQLDAVTAAADGKTDALGNSTANNLGGGATYNSTTGAVTAPTYSVNGTDVNNVGAAISELDKGWNLASNGANAGAIKAGDTVDIGTAAGETNLQVAKSGNTIQYSLSRDLDLDSVTTGNSKLDNSGLVITGGPSITTAGIDAANTNISNVADATTADQAVNKGQLDAVTAAADGKTDALGNSTANNLGGGATYNSTTGAVTAPTYSVNGTDVNNVGAAISELDKGWNLASNGANAGAIKAGDTVDIGTAAGETNLQVAKSGNTIQYSLSRDLDLDSVTTGNSKLDNSGLVITGGPSITTAGIDAANTNISNVADATTADQAVNKGQLDAVTAAADGKTDALGNSTANNLGGGATYNSTTGAVTAPTYSVNGTDVNNVGAAISELDKGWNLASNGANAGAIKAGDTVDIGTAAGETNLQVAKSGNTIQYSLSRDLDLDSVTTGNSKLDNSGLVITGGPSITTAGIDAANTNISNVADATTADQAVNKGQLDAVTAAADGKTDALGNSTANNLGGGATYNSTTGAVTAPTYSVNGTDVNNVGAAISELDKGWNLASNGANAGAIKAGDTVDIGTAAGETNLQVAKSGNTIQYSLSRDLDLDSVTTGNSKLDNSGLVITGGPSITTAGIDAANTNISNVADATTADQAVNKGQLDAVTAAADGKTDALGNSTANNLGGGATYNSTTGAVTAPTYSVNGTDVNNVGAAISELDKGWNLASNGANAGAIKAGDTVDIGTAAGETNLQVAKSGNTIQYSLSRDLDLDSVTTGNSKLDNSGLVITGGPSITTAGIDAANTNISNVADATTADQAVNKGQLDAVTAAADGKTDALGNSTANNLGGGATYNSTTGAVTAPTYSVNGTDVNNVGAAISELDKGWNLASNGANAGAIKAGDTVDIGTAAGETNLQVAKSGNTIQYSLSRDLDLDSVTTGNSKLDNSGLVITGGPSITTAGIDAANTNISNVADATTADQAVNKGQLDAVTAAADGKTDALGNSTANNLGGGATYNSTTGAVTAPTYSVNGTDVNNVGAAISELDKGWNLASNGANAGAIKAGDTVDIGTAAGETNLQVAKSGNTIQYSLSRDLDLDSVTTGNSKLDNSGLVITGGPSITTAGIDAANTNISNVADATTADQAVNKGQLDAVTAAADGKTDALGNSTANNLGGGATYNSTTGAVTAPTYSVNGTDVNNVGAAISELDKGWNLASNGANAGAIKAGDTVDIGTAAGETNLQVAKSGNTIQYSLSRDLDLDSVTTGNSKLDNSGLVITGGPSITTAGIDAANTNISNVADATTADQAVNKGQLDAVTAAADGKTDALGNSTANNLGGGATYNSTTGAVTAPTYSVNGTDVNNVGAAISELDKGWNLASNGANAGAIKAGDTVDIGTAAGETNLQVAKSGNTIQYSLSRDLDLDSVTTGNSKLDNSGLVITGGPSITTAGIDAANTNISNVADATTADQAVNKGQLDAVTAAADGKTDALGNSTANNLGGGATYNSTTGAVTAPTYSVNGTDVNNVGAAISELDKGWNLASNGANAGAIKAGDTVDIGTAAGETNLQVAKSGNTIQYSLSRDLDLDSVTTGNSKLDNSGLVITGGPSITTAGIDAANTNISNVADATTADQAVNKGQLDAVTAAADGKTDALGNSTANNLGGGATYNSTTGAVTAPTYSVNGTDVNNVGAAISELDKGWNLASNGANAGAIKAGDTVDIGTAAGETNLQVAKSGNTIQYSLSRDLDLDSVTTGNSKLDNSGLVITGGPSITTAGIDAANTNISNVADATTADQAVNKGQLDAVTAAADGKTDALGNSTANNLGGGATYNSTTGAVTAPTYSVNGTDVNNVGAAISELDKGWNLASNGANAGAIKAGDTVDIGTAAGETNLQVAKSGNTIQYSLSRDLDLDSVTTGNSKLDNSGLVITGGPSITTAGIDAANTNISNVADATTADQAVNKGQLDAVTAAADGKTDALGNSTANNLGGGATYNSTTGAVTAPTYSVNGTDVNNVGAAISELDKGWNLASNGANAGAIKAGDTVDIGTAAGETNLQVAKSGNTIQYSLSRDLDLDSVTTGNSKLDNSGLVITGGPSITTAGIDAANTNISNVADATTADQAVNKGQLDAVTAAADGKTDALGNSTANNLGGGATYNSTTGAVTAPTYSVNGTDVNNVGAAISELDKGWNLASNGANAGAIKAGDTVDIGTAAGETNLQVAKSGNTIQYSLSRDLDLDSVTTGNSKLDNSGLVITGGPSITTAGIDAANTNISNVADATTADQAVNKGQLDAVTAAADGKTDALGNSTANNLGGGATYNSTTGAVTAPTYSVNGTDVNNVGAAISELDKGWNLASNGANAGAIKAGDTVDIGTAAGETNLQVAKSGNTIQYSLSRDLDLDSVTTGNSKLDNSGLVITGGPSITTAGIDAANTNISNVADATTADQAVNKGQLDAVTAAADGKTDALGNSTANNLGGGATYNSTTGAVTAPTYSVNGTDVNNVGAAISELDKGWNLASNGANAGAIKAGDTVDIGTAAGETNLQVAKSGNTIQYSLSRDLDLDSVTTGNSKLDNSGLVITGGPSITTAGIDAANTNISNVADATTADQAVNKGQLDAVTAAADGKTDALGNSTANNLGGGATYNSTTGAVTAPTYSVNGTDVNNVGAAISELDKGWNLASNGANAGAIKAGDTVDIGTAAGETNLQVAKSGNTIQYSLSRDLDLDSVTTGNSKLDNSGLVITGGPSITTAGIDAANTNISNVADATTADQAVNKGQLDAVTAAADGKTDALGNSTANNLGGGATYNSTTGAVTAPTYSVNGTDVNNVGAAISELDKGWNLASNGANAGAIKAGDTVDIGTAAGETNLQVAKSGNTIQYSLSRDLDLDSVTTGNSKLDNSGLVITGGPSITTAGIDAANTNISNVADATTADQAVNKGQLDAVTAAADGKTDALGNSTANNLGGGATYNSTTGAVTAPTYSVNGTDVNNVGAAISELDKGWNLASNGANAGAIKAGDTVDIGVADPTDSNLTATKTGNNVAFALSKDLTLDSVTTGQIAVGNVAIDSTTNTIKGLSNKDLTAADFATQGRAATEEQLQQVISNNITEVVDGNGNKVNIIDQVVNTQPDNKNQDSLFLTYDKQGQETTDRLTIAQTVQKMNTEGVKFFHTNADTSKGDLGTTNDSSAGGLNSTAIGVNAIVEAGADSSVALGHNTKVAGAQSIAIGNGAEALGTQSISIGTGNKVNGDHSGAIGDPTIVDGSNSYSVGNNNQVLTDDTFVLGNNVTQTVAGSVVLGTGSAATTGADVAGYTLSAATTADKTAISNTTSTTGAVAVGDAANGIYRQITGVAAGTADADAVNVAQLKAVGNQVVETQTALVDSLGGNAKVNADGTITGPTYNVAQGTQTNVGDALTALDQAIGNAATTSKTTVSNGENIVVNKTKNADGSDNYEVSTAKDLTVDSIAAGDTVLNNSGINIGNNAVVLNNTGLVIAGGPSVTTQGINAGNKQITNVAAGTSATDAVNKGQLDTAISNVNNNVNELANNAVKYDDANKDKITLGGANGTTISNVKDGEVAQGSKDAVNGGQLWNVQQQVNQNTSDISNIQTNIDNINSGKSGLVQQQTPNGEITVGKDTGGTTVNVAGKDGDRVVTGVKDGAIKADSKDAVNGSQLNTTNQKIAEYLGGGAGYDNITQSFTNPTYNVGGKDYNNVGGAVDALNKADQALNTKIDNVSNRLEQAFYSTNQRIDDVEKRANAGIAAAMALETAPFVPGKYTYAAGASYHGGENAVGVTLRKTADNGRWSITGGVAAASQGDPSVRIGISGVID
ncbi:ESPR-type extended signal peptide-containing protein [Acinetobacter baumannii]|nr:ESPR-type extended signal peptide-containing protein [Acinetobacter baumannii]WFQ23452.1 ESPR-type extended signal peptide-containing protein [Acinetobacter baumannii]